MSINIKFKKNCLFLTKTVWIGILAVNTAACAASTPDSSEKGWFTLPFSKKAEAALSQGELVEELGFLLEEDDESLIVRAANTKGMGTKKDFLYLLHVFQQARGFKETLQEAADLSVGRIDEVLLLGVLLEEWDFRDLIDDSQDRWALDYITNEGVNRNPNNPFIKNDPQDVSFGMAQMKPNTLAFLLNNSSSNKKLKSRIKELAGIDKVDKITLLELLKIIMNPKQAPLIAALYLENRYQKWLPVAGLNKVTQEVLATLYYINDKNAHPNPKTSVTGWCTTARLKVFLGQRWPRGFNSRRCRSRKR